MTMADSLRLGTRGSKLAVTQSQQVADAVTAATGISVELVIISTRGDQIQDRPLPEIGGKGLFTVELEAALRDRSIDFAVHSLKDLPTDDPEGLILGAFPKRADPRDAIVGATIDGLDAAAVVGSGSLRRRVQLLDARPDLKVADIRGNVPTRIAKRDAGQYAATILAMAGLQRLGIERDDIYPIPIQRMVPAVGQGALGVQCRADDERVLGYLRSIDDGPTRACVAGERAFLSTFGGGCNVPAGCHLWPAEDGFHALAMVADDSGTVRRFEGRGTDPVALGVAAARTLA
jgi:hydroxymethylbilane synthase